MSKQILKNVEWIISVPNKEAVKNKDINSTEFSINRNGKITKWNLLHNFKNRETENLGAYLALRSDDIDFGMQITFIVLDWIDANGSKSVNTKVRLAKDWKKGRGWGKPKLISHEELYNEQSCFVKDGKLQLTVVIEEKSVEKDDKINSLQESNVKQMNAAQVDEVFKAIISVDDRGDTTVLQTVDGVKIKALKQIISQKSSVFAAMLKTDMVEKSKGAVEIISFSGKVIEELLKFMYIGRVDSIEEIDMELYDAAKVYQVDGLGDICLASIKSRVNYSNVFEVLVFANLHDQDDLFDTCSEIVCKYFDTPKIQEKIKELESKAQIRLLTDMVTKLSRYNNRAICRVEVVE